MIEVDATFAVAGPVMLFVLQESLLQLKIALGVILWVTGGF